MKNRILIVEDDPKIARLLAANLVASGYAVESVNTASEALIAVQNEKKYDLVLLDLILPDGDGLEVCREIREQSDVLIIMVTAKGEPGDAVAGLNAGADDYVAKPFAVEEVLARINAVFRRRGAADFISDEVVKRGQLELDFGNHELSVAGQKFPLTPTEFRLVRCLMEQPQKVLTHEYLLSKVWGPEYRDDLHYLRVCVNRLRQKLGPQAEIIVTVPTVGYRLAP